MRNSKARAGITPSATAVMILALAAGSQVQADPTATGPLSPAVVPLSAVAVTPGIRSDGTRPDARPHALAAGLGDFVDGAGSVAFFGSLVRAASLGELLDLDGTYTLFAPIDGAFSGLTGEQISNLIHDPASLRSLVAAHIVPGRVLATDLTEVDAVFSIAGDRIEPSPAARLQVNGAALIKTALVGPVVVHVIDGLLQSPTPDGA